MSKEGTPGKKKCVTLIIPLKLSISRRLERVKAGNIRT
jgi:hypothetical protein